MLNKIDWKWFTNNVPITIHGKKNNKKNIGGRKIWKTKSTHHFFSITPLFNLLALCNKLNPKSVLMECMFFSPQFFCITFIYLHILPWHLLGHAIMSVICFDLQFSHSTRPMTSFCIFIAYIKTEGIFFNVKITRWD